MSRNKILWYNPQLKTKARQLRLSGTRAEIRVWKYIKSDAMGCEFHRQCPIDNYIVDFYCHEIMLAIEVDSYSHYYNYQEDKKRQERLEKLRVSFLRFSDEDVLKDIDNVLRVIQKKVEELLSTSP